MSRKAIVDTLERVVWTAIQAFLATWLVTQRFDLEAVKIAGAAAVVSAAKCVLATHIGDSNSAAAIPGG